MATHLATDWLLLLLSSTTAVFCWGRQNNMQIGNEKMDVYEKIAVLLLIARSQILNE